MTTRFTFPAGPAEPAVDRDSPDIMEDFPYQEDVAKLLPATSSLFIFSDGITEAVDLRRYSSATGRLVRLSLSAGPERGRIIDAIVSAVLNTREAPQRMI